MKMSFIVALIVTLPYQARGADLKLVHRFGQPIAQSDQASDGIVYASWVDDEHVVYATFSGQVTCLSLRDSKEIWTWKAAGEDDRRSMFDDRNWSICRKKKRLACLSADDSISVIDCTDGKKLFHSGRDRLAKLIGVDYVLPTLVALTPDDGRLMFCTFSTFYGRNGYILDPSYEQLLSTFPIDAMPKEFSVTPQGNRVALIAYQEVLCVRDLTNKRDVFFRGQRIESEPDGIITTIDAPFFSHLRDGGGDTIVYTQDNSWATGRVFVHNIKTDKENSFDARNGHIEMDVLFSEQRIALTGTSTNVTVLGFDGKLIAEGKQATQQRNACIEFSPNGKQLLVGSWDNTVSVFEIVEEPAR